MALTLCAAAAQTVYQIEPYTGSDYAGDGDLGVRTPLLQPQGMAGDPDGSILVADAGDHRVRRITPDGIIHTLEGTGRPGLDGLHSPYGVAVGPQREVYIADLGNHRVQVVTAEGVTRTFAGGGETVPGDTFLKATDAKLDQPRNVAVNANGVVYIADFGANRIYCVTRDGMLLALPDTGLKGPAGLAPDYAGNLYVADSGNHAVQRLKGGEMETVLRDFGAITSIALDANGHLYAAGGDRIAVVVPTGEISLLMIPADEVAIDGSGRILTVAFRQVRSYFAKATTILAGSMAGSFAGDRFLRPTGITRDLQGNLFIADTGNGRVRRITPEGEISTVTTLGQPGYFAVDKENRLYMSDGKTGGIYRLDHAGQMQVFSKGQGSNAFKNPSGMAFDARGDLWVADTGNGKIRRIAPDGYVSTMAGGGASDQDGFGLTVALHSPIGLAVATDGTVWFTEAGRLRKYTREGRVITVPDLGLVDPRGLRLESDGSVVLADAGTHRILRISPEGVAKPIAGTCEPGYDGDYGPALKALLNTPVDILPEPDGSLLVVDSGNARVRRIAISKGSPPGQIEFPPVRVLHGATGKESPVAPGQLIVLELDQVAPAEGLQVHFGAEKATVLGVDGTKITAVVPTATAEGESEVIVSDASGPLAFTVAAITAVSPGLISGIVNADGTPNSLDTPAARGSVVTIAITGEGVAPDPWISIQIGGMEAGILSIERTPGIAKLNVRMPSGFLPSGRLQVKLRVDDIPASEGITIVSR